MDGHLLFKIVRGPVVLTSQLEALIDEHLKELAVPEQASKVLSLLVAPLTGHKSQLVKLKPITPANSTGCINFCQFASGQDVLDSPEHPFNNIGVRYRHNTAPEILHMPYL